MSEADLIQKLRDLLEKDRFIVIRKNHLVTGIVAGVFLACGGAVASYKAASATLGNPGVQKAKGEILQAAADARLAVSEARAALAGLQETDIVCRSLTVRRDNPKYAEIKLTIDPKDNGATLKFLRDKKDIVLIRADRGGRGWLEFYNNESPSNGSRTSVHIEARKEDRGGLVQVWKDGEMVILD